MNKTVYFVGGIHGSGKTTLCREVGARFGCPVHKQVRLVMQVSGLQRQEAYYNLRAHLKSAGVLLAESVSSPSSMALVDCHYAIRAGKALRLQGHIPITEYIPDLEPRLIDAVLDQGVSVKFIYIDVDPQIAADRCAKRPGNVASYENSFYGLHRQQYAEIEHFRYLIDMYKLPATDFITISNEGKLLSAVDDLSEFIKGSP